MPQLLISVKNVEEAMLVLDAGVDVIDLKDPNIGALGALDLEVSQQIVNAVQKYKQFNPAQYQPLTSATVGENPINYHALREAIKLRAEIGVDVIKVASADLLFHFEALTRDINLQEVRLMAVFFANQTIDLNILQKLKDSGFYGAMLDTQNKERNLLEVCTLQSLQRFTQACQKTGLKSGLAGSLKPQHIEQLVVINPSYMGFRGGACENNARRNGLNPHKLLEIKNMLYEHNKINGLAQQAWVCVA